MKSRLKQFAFGVVTLLILGGLALLAVKTLGHGVVRLAYENRLPAAWSDILAGRADHSLTYYQAYLDTLFFAYAPRIIGLATLLLGLICVAGLALDRCTNLKSVFFPAAFLVLAVLLMPPVTQCLLATGPIIPADRRWLWYFSLALLAGALPALWARPAIPVWMRKFLILVILAGAAEAGLRFAVHFFLPELKAALHLYGVRTYLYTYVIEGHPFLQYTPKPGAFSETHLVISPESATGWRPMRQGLRSPKPPGVCRIATLGGSTTASGWPEKMERTLNARGDAVRYEVLNYGVGWYCSAHSLINFALNAIHYDLDYVVIHDNWNEAAARNVDPAVFRTDYSHSHTSFHEPRIPDRAAIRASLLYRLGRSRIAPTPPWWNMSSALYTPLQGAAGSHWQNKEELIPFRSNVQSIIDLAKARGIRVVLTTTPYSVKPGRLADKAPHLIQCNDILRDMARREEDRILFMDLDEHFGPEMDEHFTDVGHVDHVGDQRKADLVGAVIEADYRAPR